MLARRQAIDPKGDVIAGDRQEPGPRDAHPGRGDGPIIGLGADPPDDGAAPRDALPPHDEEGPSRAVDGLQTVRDEEPGQDSARVVPGRFLLDAHALAHDVAAVDEPQPLSLQDLKRLGQRAAREPPAGRVLRRDSCGRGEGEDDTRPHEAADSEVDGRHGDSRPPVREDSS